MTKLTNQTDSKDDTILYLKKILQPYNLKITKLAYGLPMGADIDYTDEITLQKALNGRTLIGE